MEMWKVSAFSHLEQLQETSYLGLTSLKNGKFVQKLNIIAKCTN
jgi:hypothetical protein